MSAEAANWVKWHAPAGVYPKPLLRELADFADAEGRVWAAIATLAQILNKTDRQVQRDMARLKTVGLLRETSEFHRTRSGQRVPIYQLDFETPVAGERGDVDVTPFPKGVTPVSPLRGDVDVTPRGDVDVTQAKQETPGVLSNTQDGRACEAFERVGEAWIKADPDRFARPKAAELWFALAAELDLVVLERAAMRFLAESGQVKRGRVPMLHRWLADRLFEGWMGEAAQAADAAPIRPVWPGPPEIRAAIVAARGEDFAASYLDGSAWDAAAKAIVPKGFTAARALGELRRGALAGVTITDPKSSHGVAM